MFIVQDLELFSQLNFKKVCVKLCKNSFMRLTHLGLGDSKPCHFRAILGKPGVDFIKLFKGKCTKILCKLDRTYKHLQYLWQPHEKI